MAGETTVQLRDVCVKIGSGATPRGGKEAYKGGATSLIRSQNIYNEGFHRDGLVYIDDDQSAELRNVEVKPNDILLNITGDSVARCCQVAADVLPARVNQHVAIIRPQPESLDARFLRYVLVSHEYQLRLLALASAGATRPALTKSMIEELDIPSPPLAEQKAIAGVLGALDDKIELNRRMNATLEAMARALFQSWFVDFDPVRAKLDGRTPVGMDAATAALFPDSFQDSELGPIPFGWELSKLKDLTSKIGSGATPRGGSDVYVDEGPALIRSQNVYDHEFHWAGLARLTDKSASELKNVEVMNDDVLLNITGDSILRTCVVDPAVLPARVNQHVSIIRAIKGIPPRYLHLYLVQDSMKSVLIGMSAGATRHAITKGHLESTDVLKPSAQVLAAFEKLTLPWFEQIDANRTQSRTLASLRDTLLPKLLSGELSVAGALLAAQAGSQHP
jgi:type I restriction enzyme S subunit